MEFLKRHYEKIVLVLVLIGLAWVAFWIDGAIKGATTGLTPPTAAPTRTAPPAPVNMTNAEKALAEDTTPPPVLLSGDHNLFNPVTWKRKSNGDLLKILRTGPDALKITDITPLYTVISYDHPSGNGPIYVMAYQTNCDLKHPGRKITEHARVNEKMRSGLYMIAAVKGDPNNPTDLELEVPPESGNLVWISQDKPYKRVDSHIADMKYDPQSLTLLKKRENDTINLDGEDYKIVEITNDAVRVESTRTKVTQINWKP